jgi:outer membrane protein OmpA-like peptidoglycan-associated protein
MSLSWLQFAAAAAILVVPCFGQSPKPPAELGFLSTWGEVHQRDPYQAWGETAFPRWGANQVYKQGHFWTLWVAVPTSGAKTPAAVWDVVKPVALKAGWTVVSVNPNGGFLVLLHYNQNGGDAWLNAMVETIESDTARLGLELVEVAPPPFSLTLKEPAATPEKLPAPGKGDFPFLAPLPGSVRHGGEESSAPFRLTPKGATQPEIVANGSIELSYRLEGLSQLLFARVYHDALTKAGWEIVTETANHELIIAHYAKNGRNIWAYMDDHGDLYSIQVGKEASPDQIKATLATTCHVALYGVLFDFNKSTLQPASDGPLQQVASLMAANSSLNLEIQGHTDNVGGDAYNQTLSEARARSVMAWLTQHGVAAARMTAKGYGKTLPIADNSTDEGRMKNRRVEIADPRCKPQPK